MVLTKRKKRKRGNNSLFFFWWLVHPSPIDFIKKIFRLLPGNYYGSLGSQRESLAEIYLDQHYLFEQTNYREENQKRLQQQIVDTIIHESIHLALDTQSICKSCFSKAQEEVFVQKITSKLKVGV